MASQHTRMWLEFSACGSSVEHKSDFGTRLESTPVMIRLYFTKILSITNQIHVKSYFKPM
jgi:hypothetical protein